MHFLGKNIRYLRKKSSQNQGDIAILVNKVQTTIGNWENGISQPNVEELLIISNYFGISVDILLKIDMAEMDLAPKVNREDTPKVNREENSVLTGGMVKYDHHEGGPSSMVSEKEENTLSYVLNEIKAIREEIGYIKSRLGEK